MGKRIILMSLDKKSANASLQKLADAVQECKSCNAITPSMVHAIVKAEYGETVSGKDEDQVLKEKLMSLPAMYKAVPDPYTMWNLYTFDKKTTEESLISNGYDMKQFRVMSL